ncbi:hypothetical protein Tdes44962_MAKER08591 [Teratosphaeria destructans]|uniref:Uncharacterized protein n=1 Tax=Teratosphaeria destructans TaxID=418781 RepID=A0A9W7SW87_9PEZI|nr:hypothetical protein Tdes44962_MAKER08591 [Teratosphaeria destructans]
MGRMPMALFASVSITYTYTEKSNRRGTYLANCTPWIPTPPPPPGNTTQFPARNPLSTSARCIVLALHMIGPATSSLTPSGIRLVYRAGLVMYC